MTRSISSKPLALPKLLTTFLTFNFAARYLRKGGDDFLECPSKDWFMDDAEPAKRSPKKRPPAIDVAILYNVDFEEARTEADPCFEARATVESVADRCQPPLWVPTVSIT